MEGERMKGTLIVLEGIDGSGKETQSTLLEKKLRQEKREVMHVSLSLIHI